MAASPAVAPAPPLRPFERALGLVADVRSGEAATALLLTASVFLLLLAYYVVKPVRDALILTAGGARVESYSGAAQAALFLLIVPAYSRLANRVDRIRLVKVLFALFALCLVLFAAAGGAGLGVGVPFFFCVGIFNLMVVAQFWSFANDVYTEEQGKRLFALVGMGSLLGSVAGSGVASALVRPAGLFGMMLTSAVLIGVSLALTTVVHWREAGRSSATRPGEAESPVGGPGGFQLVLGQRYLLLIGLLTLVLNVTNTNGQYILSDTLKRAADDAVAAGQAGGLTKGEFIAAFKADFNFWQNVLGAAVQLFLVSRILKYVGIRRALFIAPLLSLGAYSVLAFVPVLSYVRAAKIVDNSIDYSLSNTVRQTLFLRTSRQAKYKAKQAVETFFWRTGDMVSALAVFLGPGLLGLTTTSFARINLVFVALWLVFAAGIAREHARPAPIVRAA